VLRGLGGALAALEAASGGIMSNKHMGGKQSPETHTTVVESLLDIGN
jgi:hypothetical protein